MAWPTIAKLEPLSWGKTLFGPNASASGSSGGSGTPAPTTGQLHPR